MGGMKRTLHTFIFSKTARGLVAGLYAPGRVFAHKPILPNPKYDGSVEKAWADVGNVFRQVLNEETHLGKKAPSRRDPKAKIPA